MKSGMLRLTLALACASALGSAPAQAGVINLIDGGGVKGTPAEQGFAAAAAYWSSVIENDVVINFTATYGPIGVLGTAEASYTSLYASDYYSLLGSTASSSLDQIAMSNLSPLRANGGVAATIPDYFDPARQSGIAASGTRIAPDGQFISTALSLTSANLKALVNDSAAYKAQYGDASDGLLTFSSTTAFDFDPRDGITAGQYDFVGTAIHEIGHALGLVSGVEYFDAYVGDALGTGIDGYALSMAADYFRYSAPGKLDWTAGTDSYFSVDGGQTALGLYSTGPRTGDGFYSGHWKRPDTTCGAFPGAMQAYACPGGYPNAEISVTTLDIAALDAIGWNLNVDALAQPDYRFFSGEAVALAAAVPEPGTWSMLIAGFGMVGGTLRRRATRTKASLA